MRTVRRLLLLAGVVSLLAAGEAAAQAPIKIGFLSPLSGAIAAAGKDMYSGCELYWQESGWHPEEFLKQPVYSREFPPCRHC